MLTLDQRRTLTAIVDADVVESIHELPILILAQWTSAQSKVFDVVGGNTQHGHEGRLVIIHGDGTGHVFDYLYDEHEDVRRYTRVERLEPAP
jgi:hypothetical protein